MPNPVLIINDAAGTKIFDSSLVTGGCVIDVVKETSSAQVKNYTNFAGRTVYFTPVAGFPGNYPTVSYSSGYPSVTIPAYYIADIRQATWMIIAI